MTKKFQRQALEMFCKKYVLKHFAIFTGKHLCWCLFLIKLQAVRTILTDTCVRLILKFKEGIGREIEFGTLLTNLSKALDSINYPLLTSKINSYGVFPLATNIISSYLSNRTQRNKFKENFREISI